MFRTDENIVDIQGASLGEHGHIAGPIVAPSRGAMAGKRALDAIVGGGLLLLLLPLFCCIAIGVRMSSSGPILYSQKRIGRGGRVFRFYKFRSMVPDSDRVLERFLDSDQEARSEWDTFQKLTSDPRITPFGHFIRRTSLDELPQLWNVAIGDMSLVGPRPCMPDQKRLYGPYWQAYCAMRPGISGLWQVSGRNRLSYAQRVELDAKYVREWSLFNDFKILLRTVRVVITADGSK